MRWHFPHFRLLSPVAPNKKPQRECRERVYRYRERQRRNSCFHRQRARLALAPSSLLVVGWRCARWPLPSAAERVARVPPKLSARRRPGVGGVRQCVSDMAARRFRDVFASPTLAPARRADDQQQQQQQRRRAYYH